MALKKPAAFYASTLSATISKTLTTIPVADFDDGQGGTLSGTLGFVIDEGENSGSADFGQEVIIGTISGSNLIDCIRGVSNTDGITAVAALQKKHKRGASIKISNHPYVLDIIRALNGETQLDADNIIEYDAAPAFTPGSNELATIKYADDLAIAGSPDASTTTKGISRMSVAPASATVPIAVGDNDPRVLSAGDATLVAAITADAAEINVLDGLTATQSQLNEAGTFFNTTDITGAEAETLTGGAASDASALHTHAKVNIYQEFLAAASVAIGSALGNANFVISPDESYGYLLYKQMTSPNITLIVKRYARDAGTGVYFHDGTSASLAESTYAYSDSYSAIVVGSTYVWAIGSAGGNVIIVRMNADLTSPTLMTISGSATVAGGAISAAGSDTRLYMKKVTGATAIAVFDISGTTATRGTDVTLSSATGSDVIGFDGTSLFMLDGNQDIRKYNSSGTLQSTTARLHSNANNDWATNTEATNVHRAGFCPFSSGEAYIATTKCINTAGTDTAFIQLTRMTTP